MSRVDGRRKAKWEVRLSRMKELRRIKRSYTRAIKRTFGCVVCGFDNPTSLDFHHLDRSTKLISLGQAVACGGNGVSWHRIHDELDKCIVLCKNCHALVEAGEIVLTGEEPLASTYLRQMTFRYNGSA